MLEITPMFEGWCTIKVLSVEEGYGDLHSSKDSRVIDALETAESAWEESHKTSSPHKTGGRIDRQTGVHLH